MKTSVICNYLEKYFPLHLQEEWDACGLQIGSLNHEVHKVMTALNADEESLDKAIRDNCQMLITHHPFLLEKIKNFDTDSLHGRFIKKALDNNIVVYSLHTCLDRGRNEISMNDWLINKLDVMNIENYDIHEIGKKAVLKQAVSSKELIKIVKRSFDVSSIRFNRNSNMQIKKIAICGGSAADDIVDLCKQVDCFITGDTKHRHMKIAMDNNVLLIDIGHHVEVIMEEKIQELLQPLEIEVVTANSKDYYQYQ